MSARLHSAVLVVADQDEALAFFTDVLGWVKREDNQMGPDYRFLCVAPEGHTTGIVLGKPEVHGRPAATPEEPRDVDMYLISDDLLRDYEEWTAKGVVFLDKPEPMPWGALGARFQDPFGNRYFITDGA